MKARFDAGTDAAMLGLWDVERNAEPLAPTFNRLGDALDDDARAGHVFLVHTHADGGGPVDAYVDEAIPDEIKASLTPLDGEYLLVLPSGSLIIDGAENYRARKPGPKLSDRVAAVPPGGYAVRCYHNANEEAAPRSEGDLLKAVGREEVEYYDRINRLGCLGGALTLLLFPILAFAIGWIVGLAVTIPLFLSYFHVRQWVLQRNARYARLDDVIPAFRLQQQDPTFVFELRRLDDYSGLVGGSVSL